MSIFTRFFGKKASDDARVGPLIANPGIEHPLGLQLLFPEAVPLDAGALRLALQSFHPSMAQAQCEIDDDLNREGKVFGLVGWAQHVIRLVGFDCPMPTDTVEVCVAPAHYAQDLKARARAHAGHLLLYYAGYGDSPFEQYVALAACAGALAHCGATIVLNAAAHTSLPTAVLSHAGGQSDTLELLEALPLPILFCGFVKYEVEGIVGVWMRTYGAHLLGLPDFAAHAGGHHEGETYFDLFDNVLRYLRDTQAVLAAGHTMQVEEDTYIRLREPEDEYFLESEGDLLVVEIIGAEEINR